MQKGSRSRSTAWIPSKAIMLMRLISIWFTFTASAVNKNRRPQSVLQPGGSQKSPRRPTQLSRRHLTMSISFVAIHSMRSVSTGKLYRMHVALITYRELLPALCLICTNVCRENISTTNFPEEPEYNPYENMSPNITLVTHSLSGLIVKNSLSTPNPELCSVDRCHNRSTAVSLYSYLARRLRRNGGASHRRNVPSIALPQRFRPEHAPEGWTNSIDLGYSMNRWLEIPVLRISKIWDLDTTGPISRTFPSSTTSALRSPHSTISSYQSHAQTNSFVPPRSSPLPAYPRCGYMITYSSGNRTVELKPILFNQRVLGRSWSLDCIFLY
jgi:hypothetical protein